MSADRDLMCGALALRLGLVSQGQVLEALASWLSDPATPLSEQLRRRGWLSDDGSAELARAIEAGSGPSPETALPEAPASLGATDPLVPPGPDRGGFGACRYRRLREHARGGLGEVSVAWDEELDREVALKEIQGRYADHPASRARFLREAQLTGHLEHPGVVPVYGLGVYPDGRPYYAMRFIKGESLHDALKRHHAAPSELGLRGLLGRFVAVCNAVAYAHSRGIIHRDLKPANVMLGEYGETLVVDWGLARRAGERDEAGAMRPGDAAATQAGRALGTPGYMPPEQARGELDKVGPPSDVFALGATLYHLLTGRMPYAGDNALRRAERGDWAPARQVNRRAPAALEAVCARAMAPRPEGRYAAAGDVAREVERWLADEPVEAYRDPVGVKVSRWARRHRTLVSAVGVLLLAGVVGLAGGLYAVEQQRSQTDVARQQAVDNEARARSAEGLASANYQQARANLARAEDNLKLAKKAVDECFNVAKDHPAFQSDHTRPAQRLLFERARPFYERFRRERPGDATEREAADGLYRWAYIESQIGDKSAALQAYGQARQILAGVAADRPDKPEYRSDLAWAIGNRANLLVELGRPSEAQQAFEQARDIQLKLIAEHPGVMSYQHDLARTDNNLGILHERRGRPKEARAAYERARDGYARLLRDRPASPDHRHDLARAQDNLAMLLADEGRPADGARMLEHSIDLLAPLVRDHPQRPDYRRSLGEAYNNLALLLQSRRRAAEALMAFRQVREIFARLTWEHPDVPIYQHRLGSCHVNRGVLLARLGRRPEALAALDEARDVLGPLAAAQPGVPGYVRELGRAWAHRGEVLKELNRRPEALAAYEQAREIYARLTAGHPDLPRYREELARVHYERATLLRLAARVEDSAAAYAEAIPLVARLLQEGHVTQQAMQLLFVSHLDRARLLAGAGKLRESLPDWDKAAGYSSGTTHEQIRLRRAEVLARLKEHARAAAEAEALAPSGTLDGEDRYDLACVLALCAAAARADEALPLPLREARPEALARRAVEQLRRSAAAGLFKAPARLALLDRDADLDILRQRDDYRRFRAALPPAKP